jgi:hypothetical protein
LHLGDGVLHHRTAGVAVRGLERPMGPQPSPQRPFVDPNRRGRVYQGRLEEQGTDPVFLLSTQVIAMAGHLRTPTDICGEAPSAGLTQRV